MTATLVRRDGRALGSPLRFTVAGEADAARVDAAWAEIQDEFSAVDRAMSRFRADSELTELHRRGGRRADVSPRLRRAIVTADRAWRRTGGRFDPRVVRALERLGDRAPAQPWSGGPEGAPGAGSVVRRVGRTAGLELDAPVDLGGIGKGLALRWAAARAASRLGSGRSGGSGFLIDAGGDLVARGSVGDEPWALGIEDPAGGGDPVAAVQIGDGGALATSSIRLSRWQAPDGREVHHLIDPATGEPASLGLVAVSVSHPDPAWAEVWSKALFVEGSGGIAALARSRGLAAWWIADDGELSMTPAARARTFWVRTEAIRESATA